MFLVALSASALTSRTQAQAQQSIRRATYTELMLTNSRRLQQAENEETAEEREIEEVFHTAADEEEEAN